MTKNKKLTKTIYKKIIKEEGGGGGETIHSSVLGVRLIGTNGKKYVSKVDKQVLQHFKVKGYIKKKYKKIQKKTKKFLKKRQKKSFKLHKIEIQ